ncbi:MAG: manganese-dependent inorganic pyrophosphatase [Aestuariivita sp.]|nr:manganese-dependent inorganic pyrophosphatase [Aestuariivita sp.]MCY4202425.1 manganese-dependent inorganic pyrophosphatase [Aestuariivita sp.]MCY4288635.1 manganese-dependent inorganic pyrophosphatase [Aestuariivita sp.]MCY4345593.1 manganese-dependent inorganic pyrophosphatase [Aestuariivita sp.]
MTTLVFGHTSPDTDSTGSPIIWAWYLNDILGQPAKPVLLGKPNTEASFMLDHWKVAEPEIIEDVADNAPVVLVDTNNPDELPANIHNADIRAIIDHHKLVGGLKTTEPIAITIRPLACAATILLDLMGDHREQLPAWGKGIALTCILSDTLAFRSPTTTDWDISVAEKLAKEVGVNIADYSSQMFAAKSDVSSFSSAELLRMDSKQYAVGEKNLRVSVLETTSPATILARKNDLMMTMENVAREDGVDQVLLFVVDILAEQSTLLVPNALVKSIAENSFGVSVTGDAVILPNVVSRKKQILPSLRL